MKEQATLSLKGISDLRQKLNNVDTSNSKSILSTTTAAVSLPGQPNLPAHLLKPDTPLHVSQLGTNEHDASQPGTLLHLATPQSEKVTNTTQSYAETVEYSADTADTPLHILKPDTFSQSVSYLNSSSLSLTDQQTPSPLPQLLPSAFLSLHDTSLNKSQSDTALCTPDDQTVSADTLTDDHNSEKDEVNKVTDINDNMAPNPNRFSHTNSSQDAEASFPDLPLSNKSTPSHTSLTDQESLCNNCHNKPENDDIDMDLPPPIYEPNFIRECPSPWLHYGYCTACLEVARFESLQRGQGNTIIEHIAQCPGLLNQCFTGYHEEHIKMYTERENEIKF